MEFRPYYLAREWVKRGHTVQIVAASFSHVRSVQPDMQGQDRRDQVFEGIQYTWFRTPAYQGNGLGRIFNMLAFLWALWKSSSYWADTFQPDVVIASSTYPMDIWPAHKIAKRASAKLIFEVHDLWPLSPMTLGKLSKWHPFILWVQWAEDTAYRIADKVVSMLPHTLSYMEGRGLDRRKWAHVPNGIDASDWNMQSQLPATLTSQLKEIASSGLTLVGYAGSHGLANALDNFLDIAQRMQGRAQFITVGDGPERLRLEARCAAEKISNVHFLGAIPKHCIPAFLQRIDIAYIGWHPNPLYKFGIAPNKLMDYMMAGKPVVHAVDAANDLVTVADCGHSVLPDRPDLAQQAIDELMALPSSTRMQLGENGKRYVLDHHRYETLASQFTQHW